jgi:hypothetical protein
VSHIPAAYPFFVKIHRRRIPSVVDFATVGAIVYFDLGLWAEMLVPASKNEIFSRFEMAGEREFIVSFFLIALAPWLLRLGDRLSGRERGREDAPLGAMSPRGRILFSLIAGASAAWIGWVGYSSLVGHDALWEARAAVAEEFGPLVIALYVPTYLLAFFVRQRDARTWSGAVLVLVLAVGAIVATLPIGQRTNLLRVPLILALFLFRISLRRFAVAAVVGVTLAGAVLPLFKWQGAEAERTLLESVAHTVVLDFHRANVVSYTVEHSPAIGTNVLPYAGAGYVYSALFFVPRSIAPFKGYSSATYLTAYKYFQDPSALKWGVGMGLIEELVANFGWLLAFPALVACGVMLGWAQRFSDRHTGAALVATRLGAVWMMGYHLPANLLGFGAMIAVGFIAERLCGARPVRLSRPRSRAHDLAPVTARWP